MRQKLPKKLLKTEIFCRISAVFTMFLPLLPNFCHFCHISATCNLLYISDSCRSGRNCSSLKKYMWNLRIKGDHFLNVIGIVSLGAG